MHRARRKTPQAQPRLKIRNENAKKSSFLADLKKRNQLCFLAVLLASVGSLRFRVPPRQPSTVTQQEDGEGVGRQTSSNTACSSETMHGIYHISMGDIGGAAGTIFFQFVIAQIMYAERHGLKPWVHFSNVSNVTYDDAVHGIGPGVSLTALTGRNATYVHRKGGHRRDYTPGPPDPQAVLQKERLHFAGTGVWEHYFEPVSDFVPGDRSCEDKLYVTMDLYLITPGLHGYAEYAPRCWRYKYLPDYISKPHLGLTEWLEPQRQAAHAIVQKYIHPRKHLRLAAETVNPDCSLDQPCLGLHIRHSDKASGRRVIETAEFLPFAETFLATAGSHAVIYLATDSDLVLEEVNQRWPVSVTQRIRTAGSDVLRSTDSTAVFDLDGSNHHHRVNQEVIIEILALTQCQFLVHGLSAVSESSIWLNFDLHHASVNLEDTDHLEVGQFKQLVRNKLDNADTSAWPRPVNTRDIWPDLFNQPNTGLVKAATGSSCDGYDGVLLVSSVGKDAATASAFFTSILNQLLYADRNNLKPWIHLKPGESNSLVFDKAVHNLSSDTNNFVSKLTSRRPSLSAQDNVDQETVVTSILGNGIWGNYFLPVSDFVPGDRSCTDKPLFEFPEEMVRSDLVASAPWSVKAWRYDDIPDRLVWNATYPLSAWLRRMRTTGNDIVKKYYHFQPFLLRRAEKVNPVPPDEVCLGVHLRNSEKNGKYREKISPKAFIPYIQSFVEAGGRRVYVASDSHKAIQFLIKNLPGNFLGSIQTQGDHVVRSTKLDWPLHYIETHHRVNSEALVDILALSRCQLLLHGFSTLSEAAVYLNPELQDASVNLEDPDRVDPASFSILVKRRMDDRQTTSTK